MLAALGKCCRIFAQGIQARTCFTKVLKEILSLTPARGFQLWVGRVGQLKTKMELCPPRPTLQRNHMLVTALEHGNHKSHLLTCFK